MSSSGTTISLERDETVIATITTTAETIVDGLLPYSPGLLLLLIDRFTGKSLPCDDPNEPQLPVCTLEELCPGLDRANMPEHLRDRKQFAKLGQWTDQSGRFVVGLAYTGGSENPWQPREYIAHHLVAYMMINGQANYPNDNEWTISTTISIAGLESDWRRHYFTRKKTMLGMRQSQNVYSSMFELNTKAFIDKLNRYNWVRQLSEANVICTINWKHTEVRRPDVSGIKHVLEVTELMLLVCKHLDLRSIEALRQTCKYFRDMQPLASVGSTRMQQALYRAFSLGAQRPEIQTNQIIEDFNSLLLAGGSIIGGSTALHVLCSGDWLPADLDIVVREMHRDAMAAFLTEKAGFILNEERTRDAESFYPGSNSGAHGNNNDHIRFTYLRFDNPVEGQPGVDLCVIHPWSIAAPADFVLTYHSTVVMNFWTGRSIHCLWPELTVHGRLIQNEYTPTPKVENALQKYTERGFFNIHDPRPATIRGRAMRGGPRKIRYLQDDYAHAKGQRLTIDMIPGPTWRQELIIA
ncbi:hypothetical protein DFJ43DRAFT_833786 [Lentinula guzmanii]|uniref:F-box domain-containing protein n=1 Tax=Lentinula guzmanii TaxID=2804957 RepID=A0AA38N335_9AGAR|nr:hypothetical protein DFJ43DRAFT_833786 [Lentinula guzmanii]